MKIVVIDGSGLIGRNVVRRLVAPEHAPVPTSLSTAVDTITGEGLADVMVHANVVVDVSNAPVGDDDAVMGFFTTSSRNLLAAEHDTGVGLPPRSAVSASSGRLVVWRRARPVGANLRRSRKVSRTVSRAPQI